MPGKFQTLCLCQKDHKKNSFTVNHMTSERSIQKQFGVTQFTSILGQPRATSLRPTIGMKQPRQYPLQHISDEYLESKCSNCKKLKNENEDIYNSINEFLPQQTLKNKRSLPWCNANIRPLIRKKQRCYNSACHNGKEQVWCRFRNLHKLVHKELQLPHQKYVNNLLDIDEADPVHDHAKAGITKCFWQYIKAKRKLRWNCYLEITWQGIHQNPRRKQTS